MISVHARDYDSIWESANRFEKQGIISIGISSSENVAIVSHRIRRVVYSCVIKRESELLSGDIQGLRVRVHFAAALAHNPPTALTGRPIQEPPNASFTGAV